MYNCEKFWFWCNPEYNLRHSEPLGEESRTPSINRHSEDVVRRISSKVCKRSFALLKMTLFVIPYSDTESVNVGYFIIGVCATPNPAPNILSFLLRRKKKEHWIRKKNNAD